MQELLMHVRERLCDAPLMVHERKLQAVLGGLAPRLGLAPRAFSDDDEWAQRQPDVVRKPYRVTSAGIALVPVVGLLVNRSGQMDATSAPLRSYTAIRADLRMAMADTAVRGVVLDINSPGGEAAGCFELANEIVAMRAVKPIVAAINAYAFSAAYAIAAAASHIFILEGGGAGSIGVLVVHIDQTARDGKEGLAYEFIFAGAKKVDGSSHLKMSEATRADITGLVHRLYDRFVGQVASARGIPVDAVRATEAGCFYGPEAVQQQLAQQLGTLDDAIAEATRRADAVTTPSAPGTPPRAPSSMEHPMTTQETAAPGTPAATTTPATGAAPAQGAAPAPGTAPQQGGATPPAVGLSVEDCADIVELCAMAGQPGQAAGFIRAGKSRGEVSEALLRGRAAGAQQETISTGHGLRDQTQQRSSDPADPDGWGASHARVFGQ
jgi:signal peptide peptidase SppA